MSGSETTSTSSVYFNGSEYVEGLPSCDLSDIPSERQDCPICHEVYTASSRDRIVQVPCSSWTFHSRCLQEWVGEKGCNRSCPCCRRHLFRAHINPGGSDLPPHFSRYLFDPAGEYWTDNHGSRVNEEEVSNYLRDHPEELRSLQITNGDDGDDLIGPAYTYRNGIWYRGEGVFVHPHEVHDYLTSNRDELEEYRAAIERHGRHDDEPEWPTPIENPHGYRFHGDSLTLGQGWWLNVDGARVSPREVNYFLWTINGSQDTWGPLTYAYRAGEWTDHNGDTATDQDVSMYLNNEVEVAPEEILITPDERNPHGFWVEHGEWVNRNNERVGAGEVSQWTDQRRLVLQCSYRDGDWQYPGRGAPVFVLRPGVIPDQMVSWLLNGVLVLKILQLEDAEENAEENNLEIPD